MNAGNGLSEGSNHRWGIILAGGEGTRLKEFIRAHLGTDRPKQFCSLIGHRSMFRHTIDRAQKVISAERLITVVTRPHLEHTDGEFGVIPAENVLVQPTGRETAPAILLPLLHIYRRDPQASVAIFPSDHFVLEEDRFMDHVKAGFEHASVNPFSVVLLGVEPDQPEPDLGWIEPATTVTRHRGFEFARIARFHEKPGKSDARSLFEAGSLCNTMVMVSKVWILLKLFRLFIPAMYRSFTDLRQRSHGESLGNVLEQVYENMPVTNFSKMILEQSPSCLTVLRVKGVYWNDWGNEIRVREDIVRLRNRTVSHPVRISSVGV